YVHRIGRTGRAGKGGTAISLCDHEERSYLMGIERLTGKRLKVVDEHPFQPVPGRAESAPADGAHGRDHEPRRGRFGAGSGNGPKPERGPARFGARGNGRSGDGGRSSGSGRPAQPRGGQRNAAAAPRFR
ncbi:MAG TPA: DEAD/DEAH box helicase, partial [Polyangiaceae bacterium]|nr:DEAD/DEAH box helicase [Polyangiaceae bacterium]